MQVFRIDPTTPYTFGCGLVAARDTEEAIKTFCNTEFRDYEYDEYDCTCKIIIGLDYDTDNPKLILDTLGQS